MAGMDPQQAASFPVQMSLRSNRPGWIRPSRPMRLDRPQVNAETDIMAQMNQRRFPWLIAISALFLTVFAPAAPAETVDVDVENGPPDPESFQRVSSFEMAWQVIRDTHFDPEYNGVDWDAVREEFQPQAEAAESDEEIRSIINQMVARLGQSHFGVIERSAAELLDAEAAHEEAAEAEADREPDVEAEPHDGDAADGPGTVGLQVRAIENEVIVVRVAPDSPAARAGIQPGWKVEAINNRSLDSLLEVLNEQLDEASRELYIWQAVQMRLDVPAGEVVRLRLRDGEDEQHRIHLRSAPMPGEMTQFGNLPPMNAHLETEEIIIPASEADGEERRIGIIRFNVWMMTINQEFAQAVDQFRNHDGIIIDLRGNIGGVAGMIMGFGGHFVDTSTSLGTMVTRESKLHFRINPRRVNQDGEIVAPFSGNLAILIDRQSASTSEMFAGGMQAIGRARLFGAPSAGAALPAFLSNLPNGDVLMHAIADFRDPNDVSLEGRGAIPDEPVPHQREALLDGRDRQMDTAVRWIVDHPRR
ncbi:MAG: hypothetical protein EA377_07240 [Phycisphaerales bacterium]|nr:MAG: hypothetical protein EA377_07240 [Phycisphaerales bacterium]